MALIHCHFFSQVLGLMTAMDVLLPEPPPWGEDTSTHSGPPWPTLYLLHGRSDDHTVWQRRTAIERYVEPLKLAVVMPEAGLSYYTDMVSGPRYWTFISEEMPAVARYYFPLSAKREDNYVAGISMGGYGAFKLALSFPERYVAAASLSGALDVARFAIAEVKAGNSEFVHIFGDPRSVKGTKNDLFALAESLPCLHRPCPMLYQWCGTQDFLYADNRRFHKQLLDLGLDIQFEEGPGGHEWACWDRQIQRVLDWLPGLKKA